jgi:uncharacterized protein YvpB
MYSQKSQPWGSEKLGNSDLAIKDYGCLITDEANILNFFGKETTPEWVNNKLKLAGGFDGGNYVWGSITKIFPDIIEKYKRTASALKDADISTIKHAIDSGFPVMIWIDYNPKTVANDMHWVTIVGYDETDENNFTIVDPIDGQMRSLKDYLKFLIGSARRTIEAYVIYEGQAQSQTVEALQNENAKLKEKINGALNILNS